MVAYTLEPTDDTPLIDFNPKKQIFHISGKSMPENAESYYAPLIEWTKKYARIPRPKTVLNIDLEYFNSSSIKQVIRLLIELEEIVKQGKKVTVNWIYEEGDDFIEAKGIEIRDIVDIPFKLKVRKV